MAKSIGYYVSGWQKVGTSTITTGSPLRQKLTVAYTGAAGARTVRWLENGNGSDVRATRSTPDPATGDFIYGPDAPATVDACFDNVRLRSYVFPEPTARLGSAIPTGVRVTVGGGACTNVSVPSADRLTCVAPAHAAGPVAVTVANPDGQAATKAGAVVYTDTMAATPAASPVFLPLVDYNYSP